MMEVVEGTAADLGLLSTNLKLVIPPTVKECRRKREPLSTRARQDVIKNSLILLQATIVREKPTASEFELCSQKIVALIDLFSLYILFSHFRPRDALMGIFLLFFH